jgi:hypothetical protein
MTLSRQRNRTEGYAGVKERIMITVSQIVEAAWPAVVDEFLPRCKEWQYALSTGKIKLLPLFGNGIQCGDQYFPAQEMVNSMTWAKGREHAGDERDKISFVHDNAVATLQEHTNMLLEQIPTTGILAVAERHHHHFVGIFTSEDGKRGSHIWTAYAQVLNAERPLPKTGELFDDIGRTGVWRY